MSLLQIEGISKSFGGLMAVRDLNLEVKDRQIIGVIGPNGAGKTTLLNLIAGFYKPDAGRIYLQGEDITNDKSYQVCHKGIARLFQLVKPFVHMTTLENVMVGRIFGRVPAKSRKEAKIECQDIIEFVGLKDKSDTVASNLTLADRKKVEMARALACRPHLLLLDELMAGLNPVETETVMNTIRMIRDSGVTVMIVEHIVKAVMGISDSVIVLSAGEKIAEGPPDTVVNDQRVIEAYLGRTTVA